MSFDAFTLKAIARELNNSETAFVLPAEGDDHDIRFGEHLDSLVASVMLIFCGMDTAEKRKRHISSPLSKFAEFTALSLI